MPTILSNPSLSLSLKAQLTSGASPAIAGSQVNHSPPFAIGAGSTPGNVDRCYAAPFTVSAGTPLTINVSTALDPLQNTTGMLHVSAILIENDSTVAGQDMTIGGGTHPISTTDNATAQANGGAHLMWNPNPGYTVTAGAADTVTISVAAGANVPGKITILGRSA
ncbi:MAG: hypothetical protein M3O30_17030 [Planctomycetota bacterium]|nr:hypothetical protein [Planctomycetota bacterium]